MNELKQPKKDSNAARGKSPIRLLQAVIASGTLSPAEHVRAISRLASLKEKARKERKAKAVERQAKQQEKQPHGREWRPMNAGLVGLYETHHREGLFTGTLSEWSDILRSCTFGHEREGQDFYKILAEVEAERQKEPK